MQTIAETEDFRFLLGVGEEEAALEDSLGRWRRMHSAPDAEEEA